MRIKTSVIAGLATTLFFIGSSIEACKISSIEVEANKNSRIIPAEHVVYGVGFGILFGSAVYVIAEEIFKFCRSRSSRDS